MKMEALKSNGVYSLNMGLDSVPTVERPILEVRHLGKKFGNNQVLRDVDFKTYTGDVICIIGSSGSGKSYPVEMHQYA